MVTKHKHLYAPEHTKKKIKFNLHNKYHRKVVTSW